MNVKKKNLLFVFFSGQGKRENVIKGRFSSQLKERGIHQMSGITFSFQSIPVISGCADVTGRTVQSFSVTLSFRFFSLFLFKMSLSKWKIARGADIFFSAPPSAMRRRLVNEIERRAK